MCGLLTWYGLLRYAKDPQRGQRVADLLGAFWEDNSAKDPLQTLINASVLLGVRLEEAGAIPQMTPPPATRAWVYDQLRALIERHVTFGDIPAMLAATPGHPTLYFGAADVLSGEFLVFQECCPDPEWARQKQDDLPPSISIDTVLASAAVPPTLPAVRIPTAHGSDHVCWDGLFSDNPPARCMLERDFDHRPDELWVLQIDPETRASEPMRAADIIDRKFEMSSNLSLNSELHWIKQINKWIDDKILDEHHPDPAKRFKRVEIARIQIGHSLGARLDLASKADRSPGLMRDLLKDGHRQAARFLHDRSTHSGKWWEPSYPHRS